MKPRRLFPLVLLVGLVAGAMLPAAFAQPAPCTLPPRLIVGESGRVLSDVTLNVRDAAGRNGTLTGQLPPMTPFTITGQPVCVDGLHWYAITAHLPTELIGWVAEGAVPTDPTTAETGYWTEPRGTRSVTVGAFDQPRGWVTTADGSTEAEGCAVPPDDYTRQTVRGGILNGRTLAMLDQAQLLYAVRGGRVRFRDSVTQGSYTGGTLAASFGTHDAGGAVDIRITRLADGRVNYPDIGRMIEALRAAGFAAWLRETDQLYAGSPIHIHAIAVGDAELSPAAYAQVYGERGYLAGWDALPPDWGGPSRDQHGGPVLCAWMN